MFALVRVPPSTATVTNTIILYLTMVGCSSSLLVPDLHTVLPSSCPCSCSLVTCSPIPFLPLSFSLPFLSPVSLHPSLPAVVQDRSLEYNARLHPSTVRYAMLEQLRNPPLGVATHTHARTHTHCMHRVLQSGASLLCSRMLCGDTCCH